MKQIIESLESIPEDAECLYIILVNDNPSEYYRDYIILLEKPWVKKDFPHHTSYLEMLHPLTSRFMRQRYIDDLSDFQEIKLKFILKWKLVPRFIVNTYMNFIDKNLCKYESTLC